MNRPNRDFPSTFFISSSFFPCHCDLVAFWREKEHAKRFIKFLEGGEVEITASFPAGVSGTTKDNLKAAADDEQEEHTKFYIRILPEVAKQEGFAEIAIAFRTIALVEKHHEARYRKLYKQVEEGTVFKKEKVVR
ncbi:MAG: ferritin family protein [Bacteroidota bacterium]